ncbi:hypothetical protein BAE44_0013780 [Dichanthelium oligosanthes]|uniref:Uncharacterized protein n=1 Tax=Dichanthelium oligosanthes TaxID=888268 RepID=A0A1E5VJC2_9POAL|nr:hypothetical protein BAE44_0013780 [Dichanthelium oligosanthes]
MRTNTTSSCNVQQPGEYGGQSDGSVLITYLPSMISGHCRSWNLPPVCGEFVATTMTLHNVVADLDLWAYRLRSLLDVSFIRMWSQSVVT